MAIYFWPPGASVTIAASGSTGVTAPTTALEIGGVNPSGNLIALPITSAGAVKVDGSTVTQPVSLATLPSLASGSATIGSIANTSFAATQSGTWTVGLSAGSQAIGSVTVSNFPATQAVTGTFWQTTQPVSAASLPLPTGAAQDTTVSTMSAKLPSALGQTAAASSLSVALANEDVQDLYITGQSAQTATINNILPATASANANDFTGYRSASVQVNSTGTAGTYIFEGSNDNSNFVSIPVWNQLILTGTPITSAVTASATNIVYIFPVTTRYVRLRIATTITGGSIQAFTKAMQMPFAPPVQQIAQATAGNLNVTAAIAATQTLSTVTTVGTVTAVTGITNALPAGTNALGGTSTVGTAQANAPVYNSYSSTNAGTSSYVQLVASTSNAINCLEIYDTSGQILYLATGASGSEVPLLIIPQGGNGRIPVSIASGTRLSVKAITATANSGYILLNMWK